MPKNVYLDHNSSTPVLAEVAEVISAAQSEFFANPESQHESGRQARRAIETARTQIGKLLGAKTTGLDADRLIFTSGVTESNTLALRGILGSGTTGGSKPSRLAISSIEHVNLVDTAMQLEKEGCQVDFLPVDSNGLVQLAGLEKLLEEPNPPQLVSVVAASNETGVVQPIAEIARMCRPKRVLVHTDAAQLVGKLPIDFATLGVDALSLSGHKFHGPNGVGGLLLRHGVGLTPQMHGGHQQEGFRPGTESVALALGMAKAIELFYSEAAERVMRLTTLRDHLEEELAQIYPAIQIIGANSPRLPQTSCVSLVGLDRQALVMALDLAGVSCSSGSACASGSSEPSPILQAMGLPNEQVASAIRLSLGATTTREDIDLAIDRIRSVCAGFPASI